MPSREEVRAIKKRHSAELMSRPGVCGVGVEKDADGQFVLAIHLDQNEPQLRDSLPSEIENCPVKLIASGPFRPLSE